MRKRVYKDLENRNVEFSGHLNRCVCLHLRQLCSHKETLFVIPQMFWQKQWLKCEQE